MSYYSARNIANIVYMLISKVQRKRKGWFLIGSALHYRVYDKSVLVSYIASLLFLAGYTSQWFAHGNSWYNLRHSEAVETTWVEAETDCLSIGAHLVSIDNVDENNVLRLHLGSMQAFIGVVACCLCWTCV